MPLFIITARDKPNSLDLRVATRPAHLAHATSIGDRLKLAGPLLTEGADPKPCGSFILFEADDLAAAKAFAAADPYATAGLFETVSVDGWNAAVGAWRPAS